MSDAAPVLQEMDPKYHLVQFNGTLGHKSEYCGEPTPELDAVWDKWAYGKNVFQQSSHSNRQN